MRADFNHEEGDGSSLHEEEGKGSIVYRQAEGCADSACVVAAARSPIFDKFCTDNFSHSTPQINGHSHHLNGGGGAHEKTDHKTVEPTRF